MSLRLARIFSDFQIKGHSSTQVLLRGRCQSSKYYFKHRRSHLGPHPPTERDQSDWSLSGCRVNGASDWSLSESQVTLVTIALKGIARSKLKAPSSKHAKSSQAKPRHGKPRQANRFSIQICTCCYITTLVSTGAPPKTRSVFFL